MIVGYYRANAQSPVQIIDSWENIQTAHTEALANAKNNCLLWVNVQAPNDEEMKWLQDCFNLHPLVVEDILHRDQRSKLEEYQDYLFIVLHRPIVVAQTTDLNWEELHVVVSKHWVITALDANSPQLEKVVKQLAAATDVLQRGIGALVYHLCDNVVDAYFPIADAYEDELDKAEDEVLVSPTQFLLDLMFRLKRNIVEMRRYLAPQRDVFRMLLDRSEDYFDKHARPYFRDVYDHQVRVYDTLDTLRDQVGNATDLYLSVVNNNMNLVVKRLTVITTIFMPITFVTGVFGMNFGHLPQVEHDPGWLFWVVLLFMAIVAALMYWMLKRLKLI